MKHAESVWPSGITVQRFADPDPLPAAFGRPLPDPVLERIALHWADREGLPATHVIMREEELGYAIWAPGRRSPYSTFIDKVTGRHVGLPHPDRQDEQYARQLAREDGLLPRPGFGGPEVDPPAVVAEVHLTGPDGPHPAARGVSARTGQPPALHPLVAARLAAIPGPARIRGAERHAELIALGGAVAAADRDRAAAGRPALTPADLDGAGLRATVELHRVRDAADRRTGGPGDPCVTCAAVLGVPALPFPARGGGRAARLRMHLAPARPAGDLIERLADVPGVDGRHEPSRAAVRALGRYLGKRWETGRPGRVVRSAWFVIEPAEVADTVDTLRRVGDRLGTRLFPFGSAELEGILAIAPDGRLLLIDEAGEWLLGRSARQGLDTLMLGRSAPRLPG